MALNSFLVEKFRAHYVSRHRSLFFLSQETHNPPCAALRGLTAHTEGKYDRLTRLY